MGKEAKKKKKKKKKNQRGTERKKSFPNEWDGWKRKKINPWLLRINYSKAENKSLKYIITFIEKFKTFGMHTRKPHWPGNYSTKHWFLLL
jgi:endo-1,4-beta-mannosidase